MPSKKKSKNRKMEGNVVADFPQPQLESPPAVSEVMPSASHPPQSLPHRTSEPLMHKNRLQEFAQRTSLPLPVYQTFNEGSPHAPRFKSNVVVDGMCYSNGKSFLHRKAAEQDVAKYALECLSKKLKDEGCPLIHEDTVLCKSILNEYAVKMNLKMPIYNTTRLEGVLPLYVSSLVFNGVEYIGEKCRTKKEAERLAARATILSLFEDPTHATFLLGIIKSKSKFFVDLNKVKDPSDGTTPTGANTLIPNSNSVESATVANSAPTSTFVQPSSGVETADVTNSALTSTFVQPSSGVEHPHHEFKIPKSATSSECIDLPIIFVPPVTEQDTNVGESSTRKRCREEEEKG